MSDYPRSWQHAQISSGIRYKCGYCDADTAPSRGWFTDNISGHMGYVLICTNCNKPSFVDTQDGVVEYTTPSPKLGNQVVGLPKDVADLYDEARRCGSTGAYTSAVLTCRKILMHVAVEKGAPAGKKFIEYVDYLSDNNFIPPDGKIWVDHIRSKANEDNHEIVIVDSVEAADLISFTEMLLRLVYEFKHRLSGDNSNQLNNSKDAY